jgi:hypothetical protein
VRTTGYSGFVEDIEADRTFFAVFDCLVEQALQANFIFCCGMNGLWRSISIASPQLGYIVFRNQSGMQRKLSQASEHTQNIRLDLQATIRIEYAQRLKSYHRICSAIHVMLKSLLG